MDKLAPAFVSQSANTCEGCLSLAFRLDFVLVGVVIVAALAATYLAGRMDKRKERGPWAKGNGDS